MNQARVLAVLAGVLASASARADTISIRVDNLMASDSFFLTPLWVGAHDGTFDTYDGGAFASGFPGITEIAELGDTSVLSGRFASEQPGGRDATITAVAFDGDAPVFSPGESATYLLDVGDASTNRYFSYASMVIPSNDLFVANGNPMAHQLFDASGSFLGPVVIDIYGWAVNDNGTEVNDAHGGAAFSANGGTSVDEFLVVRGFFTDSGDVPYLESFIGSLTGNGAMIGSTFSEGELIARITVVPAPGALSAFGMVGVIWAGRRRR